MRLSEAIRLGAAMKPQTFGHMTTPAGRRTCAIGAAAESLGVDIYGASYEDFPPHIRAVLYIATNCPVCGGSPIYRRTMGNAIVHLNDIHRWTRERIADFVELHEPLPESSGLLVSEPDAIPAGAQK